MRATTVVPAIPPKGPVLSLVTSSLQPDNTSDPKVTGLELIPAEQRANLPADLWRELNERVGDEWVRGFRYAPESHAQAELRDVCDFTSDDVPALPAPSGLALSAVAGGTVTAAAHAYQVVANNPNGHTTPCALVSLTPGSVGSIKLTWQAQGDLVTYDIYGRVAGSIGYLATVGPFDDATTPTWTDTGAATPGAIPPVTNTTAGVGYAANPPIVEVFPFLILAEDDCSSWGFEERDFKGRAERLVDNATPQAIEREFWSGALGTAKGYPNNFLTNPASYTDLNPAGATPSVARGLQMLQQALASCGFGGRGMIHTPVAALPNLLNVRRVGNLMLDELDNIVVPGVGYSGVAAGVGTVAVGTTVMIATDLVMTRAEEHATIIPDTFAEALDRSQGGHPNEITFRAQRFGCAYFDGACHFAVRVLLPT